MRAGVDVEAIGISPLDCFLQEIPSNTARKHSSSVSTSIPGPYAAPARPQDLAAKKRFFFYTLTNILGFGGSASFSGSCVYMGTKLHELL